MITPYVLLVLAASVLGNHDLEDVCPDISCFLETSSKFSDRPANKITEFHSRNGSDLEVLRVTPNLEYLHVESCGSDFKIDVFPLMTDLKEIYINNCSISELQKYQFKNVINVQWITLFGNSLEILFNETFHKLSRVTILSLENNLIKDLPEQVFYPLENIFWLFLSNNNISILPKDIFSRNTELKSLSLRGNPLKTVHLDFPIWTFSEIRVLDLSDCEELRDLRLSIRVDILDIMNSEVERLQVTGSIRRIGHENSKVTHADLSGTSLQRSFEQTLCGMPSLEWLDLSNSSKRPDYFDIEHYELLNYFGIAKELDCTFTNLHYLNLSGNQLSNIPCRLPLLGPSLTTLDLSDNKLENGELLFGLDSSQEEGENFPNLRFLNMSRNKLKKIPPMFPLLGPNLFVLDLSHNLLEDVSLVSFVKAQNLQSLYLEGNRLSSFDYLSVCNSLKNLKRLALYDNWFNSTFYDNMRKYLRDNYLSAEIKL